MTAPWTLGSHASMFTGRWQHDLSVGIDTPLDAEYPTLAEVLSDQGYATGGFVANRWYCTREFGLARGFTHYEDYQLSPTSLALSWGPGEEMGQQQHDTLQRSRARPCR